MTTIVFRPPTDTAPGIPRDRDRPLLTLRLSDGHTWSHEFGASSHDDLREGCFEAWVACRIEWQRRADALPAHQTRKRGLTLACIPRELQLHVLDTTTPGRDRAWLNANYGTRDDRRLVIRCPGTAPDAEAWEGADWLDTWRRCLRAWWSASELSKFLQSFARDLELEERIAEAVRHMKNGAGPAGDAQAPSGAA